jgi:hypothetical protein
MLRANLLPMQIGRQSASCIPQADGVYTRGASARFPVYIRVCAASSVLGEGEIQVEEQNMGGDLAGRILPLYNDAPVMMVFTLVNETVEILVTLTLGSVD